MKSRFILCRRKLGGIFYVEDTQTKKQESLGAKIRAEATTLLIARNQSARQPQLNLQITKTYLAGTDFHAGRPGSNEHKGQEVKIANHLLFG
jgi:hypothetical protein